MVSYRMVFFYVVVRSEHLTYSDQVTFNVHTSTHIHHREHEHEHETAAPVIV